MQLRSSLIGCLVLLSASNGLAADSVCTPVGSSTRLARLPEASGIAAGHGAGAPLFAINDSGRPELSELDRSGQVIRQVQVTGAELTDWEDITVGPCGDRTCVYVADIGDNNRRRPHVSIVRMPQPRPGEATVMAETFQLVYPDGPHDAEAMFMAGAGALFIVTKEARGAAVYRTTDPLASGKPGTLRHVADLAVPRVTGADTSPDGRWTALRTNHDLLFFRTADLVSGRPGDPIRVDLRDLREPQGEGVAFGSDGEVYLVGEGGGRRRPGTFAMLKCRLP